MAQSCDQDAGPEPASVLAQAPPLVLPSATLARLAERPPWDLGPAVLLGVEGGEVAADDLVGGIALQAFGADVPADDRAVGVAKEDRVVGHAGDERAKLLLARPQSVLTPLALGDISHDV